MNYEFELTEENLKKSLVNDTLSRNSRINVLLKLINSLRKNTIISIDGAWGTGKSVFVKQIETINRCVFLDDEGNNLNIRNIDNSVKNTFNDNYMVYYYNAWENDLHSDPLQSLLLFLLNELPRNEDVIVNFDEFKKNLPSHILKIFGGVGSTLLNGINNKTKDITGIDLKETIDATVDLAKDISKLPDYKSLADKITTTNEIKEAIDNLINDLLKENKKIVFIIDELDRCRPDYAVRLLETITHFYNNDKIVFLVSSNSSQLSHTISRFYGDNFDGYGYLNKIFNFMVSLENVNPADYVSLVYHKSLSTDYFDLMALSIFEYYNFSMREIGRYMYYMEILSDYYYEDQNSNDNQIVKLVFMPYCLGMKLKDIKQYNEFISGEGLDSLFLFLSKTNNCKKVVDKIYDFSLNAEEKEKLTVEQYVKNIYNKYFQKMDNDDRYKKITKKRFFEVLSLISNFSSIS